MLKGLLFVQFFFVPLLPYSNLSVLQMYAFCQNVVVLSRKGILTFGMQKLNFPEFQFRIESGDNGLLIFDPVRKKNVALTPEEWVRQHLIRYLFDVKGVPQSLLASERGLLVNGMQRRFDVLVFSRNGKPLIIAECKAPHVTVSEDTFYQAARYNLALKADYLLITNGLQHFIAKIDYQSAGLKFLEEIPDYEQMLNEVPEL